MPCALRSLLCALFVSLSLLATAPARAHDPGMSALTISLDGARAHATLHLSVADVDRLGRADRGRDAAQEVAAIRLAGATLTGGPAAIATDPDGGTVIRRSFERPAGGPLEIRSPALAALGTDHKQLVRLVSEAGETLDSAILDARSGAWRPRPDAGTSVEGHPAARIARFAVLGAVHVAEGPDHAAFLLAVLLGCLCLGGLLARVTAFTAAHSFSLGLAAFGLVELPARFVEPAIAATIVAVALWNLLPGERRRAGLATVFAFGLLHGLGFAGQLGELRAASQTSLVPALLGFNLGIELAQIAAVSLVYPLLASLRRAPAANRLAVRGVSLGLAGLGVVWLAQRLWA